MPIPKNINKEHVIEAIQKIDKEGVPERRESTRFTLSYGGKYYPPIYVISIANIFANGEEYSSSMFSGGDETNRFLKGLGFSIVENNFKNDSEDKGHWNYLKSHSWEIISGDSAIKTLDKSAFLHHGTGIPKEIRSYFYAQGIGKGKKREIVLEYRKKVYHAAIEMDKQDSPRSRLLWKADFSEIIKNRFPRVYASFRNNAEGYGLDVPKLKFQKVSRESDRYIVEFLSPIDKKVIVEDLESEEIEWDEQRTEGKVISYYGKRYERDPVNRKRAIEIHGLSCVVCGFNFEEVYGEMGKDFIEVHHIKPLSSLDEEIIIDPAKDLVPVCSNCHKMIHRRKDNILNIEELRSLIIKK
jgi:5-methylcytosine-specific restriction enzyme A